MLHIFCSFYYNKILLFFYVVCSSISQFLLVPSTAKVSSFHNYYLLNRVSITFEICFPYLYPFNQFFSQFTQFSTSFFISHIFPCFRLVFIFYNMTKYFFLVNISFLTHWFRILVIVSGFWDIIIEKWLNYVFCENLNVLCTLKTCRKLWLIVFDEIWLVCIKFFVSNSHLSFINFL